MYSNEKNILMAFMTFTLKLDKKDPTIIDDIELITNMPTDQMEIDPSLYTIIEENILRKIFENADISFIESIIDKIVFIDNVYLKCMIELSRINTGNLIDNLNEILDTPVKPVFKSARHEFIYYQTISRYAISTGNAFLIEKAINMVQEVN